MSGKKADHWKPVGGFHVSTDDYEWYECGLKAKGAYYRVSHSCRDTHEYYAESSEPHDWSEPKHRAEVMIRLLGDKEREWVRAIKRREARRKALKKPAIKRKRNHQ